MNINERIKQEIKKNIDLKYLSFHSSLVPNIDTVQGVRVPILRLLAKDVSKDDNVMDYLKQPTLDSYEEITIYGLVIGYLKLDLKTYQTYLKQFIPYIDNWATCDVVVSNLKFTKCYQKEMYPFLLTYLKSKKEFEVRFSLVMFLTYYLDETYIHDVLSSLSEIHQNDYYVKMAIAWLISISYIKYPKVTLEYLEKGLLDSWTYQKALQKILESYRVSKEEKEAIRALKNML